MGLQWPPAALAQQGEPVDLGKDTAIPMACPSGMRDSLGQVGQGSTTVTEASLKDKLLGHLGPYPGFPTNLL